MAKKSAWRKAPPAGTHSVYLPDELWERLELEARHRKMSISTLAQAIFNQYLPHFTVIRRTIKPGPKPKGEKPGA